MAEIAREEGFALNRRKSTFLGSGGRQAVCGVVVNIRPNVVRDEYDRLKAMLHNAARLGPQSQNRSGVLDLEAHLRGRIAWIAQLNPGRGERLRRLFAKVDWDRRRRGLRRTAGAELAVRGNGGHFPRGRGRS